MNVLLIFGAYMFVRIFRICTFGDGCGAKHCILSFAINFYIVWWSERVRSLFLQLIIFLLVAMDVCDAVVG